MLDINNQELKRQGSCVLNRFRFTFGRRRIFVVQTNTRTWFNIIQILISLIFVIILNS
jgi:hypothetical protein